jgi:hypothetical protein
MREDYLHGTVAVQRLRAPQIGRLLERVRLLLQGIRGIG